MMEFLESRRLFAITVGLSPCGVLTVVGTPGDDTIFITESNPGTGNQFDVGIQEGNDFTPVASVPESMVHRVELFGGAGNDFLVLQTSGSVGGDVWGDGGDDEVHLEDDGNALSTGHGGKGNDLMVIFAGHGTAAFGDDGDDTLISFEDTNLTELFGGNGNDILIGTDHTFMLGGRGHDTITVT